MTDANNTMFVEQFRPYHLDDVIGQEKNKKVVLAWLRTGRMPRSVLISGEFSAGKCVTGDSLVPSARGLVRIDSLVDSSKAEGFNPLTVSVATKEGPSKTTHGFHERTRVTVRMRTKRGYQQEATPEHPVLVMTSDGYQWKAHEDLVVGDYVAVARGTDFWSTEDAPLTWAQPEAKHFREITLPAVMTPKLAWVLGSLTANGQMGEAPSFSTSSGDKALLDKFDEALQECFPGLATQSSVDEKAVFYKRFSSVALTAFFSGIGVALSGSEHKSIPECVLRSTRACVHAFVAGYTDFDSGTERGNLLLCSASPVLMRQMHAVLTNFGIVPRFWSKSSYARNSESPTVKDYHYLSFSDDDQRLFYGLFPDHKRTVSGKQAQATGKRYNPDVIPFLKEMVQQARADVHALPNGTVELNGRMERLALRYQNPSNLTYAAVSAQADVVENYAKLGHPIAETVKGIVADHFYWDPVVSTEVVVHDDPIMVYDFTVGEHNPTFVANGIVNHNTTIARIIGRTLLCQNPAEGKACGECHGCKNFDKGNHPDYIEVDAASDRGINEMKDLARKLQMMPLQGKKKILVLDEAHQITGPGWQALLKTMEEPPEHVVIIVATTNPEKLPQTIVSRCSVLKLQAVTVEECTALLLRVSKKQGLAKAGLTEEHLIKIAKVTHAHPRNALHALDQVYTMVLDANDGGQTVDNTLINGFISQVAVADVDVTAAAIVRSVLDGKPGGAIKRAEDNRAQADYLLTKVLAVMRQALLYSTSKKLLDPYYKEVIEDCAVFNLPNAKRPVLEAYEAFVRVRVDTADHVVPVADVIDAAIARAGFIMQDFLKSEAPAKAPKAEPEPAEAAPPKKKPTPEVEDAAAEAPAAPKKKPAPADDDPPWNNGSPSKPNVTFPKRT